MGHSHWSGAGLSWRPGTAAHGSNETEPQLLGAHLGPGCAIPDQPLLPKLSCLICKMATVTVILESGWEDPRARVWAANVELAVEGLKGWGLSSRPQMRGVRFCKTRPGRELPSRQ